MAQTMRAWLDWGNRFRTQIKEKSRTLAQVAEKMNRAESTLRSWTNGTREINLLEFFQLCEAAEVDAAAVLFGRPLMTDAQRKAIGELTASLMEKDPTSSPNYDKFAEKVRKSVSRDKAAMSRATSRLKT